MEKSKSCGFAESLEDTSNTKSNEVEDAPCESIESMEEEAESKEGAAPCRSESMKEAASCCTKFVPEAEP
jgi:hypothetical protein